MIRMLITVLISISLFCLAFTQDTCENHCGAGTLQEYWDGEVDCVCSLDCAGYGSACCDFYDECFENPSNLEFSDFIDTWNGNITNEQTWSYDDPISIDIESNGGYTVTNNPGGHLVSDSYPGTEEVHYNSSTNILTFQWVLYYHYACGGACYSGVTFQVMEYGDGEMTLFYNNGSGPAPQANSMFLSLEGWGPDLIGDINQDGSVNVNDVVIAVNIILGMSPFNELADINGDGLINVQDIILLVDMILNPMNEDCYIEPEVGPCDGICPTYYYNQNTNQCEEFITGCCGVEAFDSMQNCIEAVNNTN